MFLVWGRVVLSFVYMSLINRMMVLLMIQEKVFEGFVFEVILLIVNSYVDLKMVFILIKIRLNSDIDF